MNGNLIFFVHPQALKCRRKPLKFHGKIIARCGPLKGHNFGKISKMQTNKIEYQNF